MHMSKHVTDNIAKTELIVESKLNNMVNENMSYILLSRVYYGFI